MYHYGGITKTVHAEDSNFQVSVSITLTKDVLSCILNCLKEEHWYKLKFNRKIVELMRSLRKTGRTKDLARQGAIESLAGRHVKFRYICEYGSLNLVRRVILKQKPDWNDGLIGACFGGHRAIVHFLLDNGANKWNKGLQYACGGGHKGIVNLMINKGANKWNDGLCRACMGGHLGIANLMIDHGADDFDKGLLCACRFGHIELVNLMIDKGADDWNNGLFCACHDDQREIIKLMISKGATD